MTVAPTATGAEAKAFEQSAGTSTDASFEADEEAFGQMDAAPAPVSVAGNGSSPRQHTSMDPGVPAEQMELFGEPRQPTAYTNGDRQPEGRGLGAPLVVLGLAALGVAAFVFYRRRRRPRQRAYERVLAPYERALTSNKIWRFARGSASSARKQAEQII
jgi:LPXTG-motif cell wall-anchored protein